MAAESNRLNAPLPPRSASLLSDPRNLLMVKDSVALLIRDEIIQGKLAPGDRIVEGTWAARLGVAQTSVREAINSLIAEGFVQKGSGKTATVTSLSSEDQVQIYQLRAVLEGLAARLVVERKAELSPLQQSIEDMRSAVACRNIKAFYERDMRFHLLICETTGNRYLEQHLRRLIVPLFAFVVMRVHGEDRNPETWARSIEQHQQILQAISSGDPFFAEQQVRNTIYKFFSVTHGLIKQEEAAERTTTG